MRRKLAAGNWKMNGTVSALAEVEALISGLSAPDCEVLLCPPATLIARMAGSAQGSFVMVGGQDCHAGASGAYTGDISAAMLVDAGASHVILGHSERRADHGETSAGVRAKVAGAHAAGLVTVVCVGETEAERDAGQELEVIGEQLAESLPDTATGANTVVAYEPVWAIGSGRIPTEAQIGAVHAFLRQALSDRFGADGDSFRLLYGGSAKPANAAAIFAIAEVDGALVGGASLKADDFGAIIRALDGQVA
jgi:triosephosphate isomerase